MPLFGRKKEVSEIQEVKEAVERPSDIFEKPSEVVEMLRGDIEMPMQKLHEFPKVKEIPTEKPAGKIPQMEMPKPVLPVEEKKEKTSFAPLFVKLDRYKQILNTLAGLRTTVAAMKNNFAVLNELERMKVESLKMIQLSIEKMEKELVTLDSEFLRPSGFHEEIPPELYSPENLGGVLTDLRSQIEQLRTELQMTS